jgi:hypothetical protein
MITTNILMHESEVATRQHGALHLTPRAVSGPRSSTTDGRLPTNTAKAEQVLLWRVEGIAPVRSGTG